MMSFGQTHLPYDKEDEGSAQHQGQHVAEGRKGERHGCSSQPYSQMWREKSGALLGTPPPPCPSSGSYLLLWASNFLLSSELSCVCVSSRWGLVSSVIRSRSCAVSHHALSFSVTAMVIRGGVASLLKGVSSVAGPMNHVSISDRQNVRLLLHIFVFSLQPDEPKHVVSLTLQRKHKVSAWQAGGQLWVLLDPEVSTEIFLSARARLLRAGQSVVAGCQLNCCFWLETP